MEVTNTFKCCESGWSLGWGHWTEGKRQKRSWPGCHTGNLSLVGYPGSVSTSEFGRYREEEFGGNPGTSAKTWCGLRAEGRV